MSVAMVASHAVVGGASTTWLNHVTILSLGTHGTVDPSTPTASGGLLKAGTGFTPTAGRLLVAFAASAASSTVPTGWTLASSSANSQGLYAWYKTAAGSDTLAGITHNSTSYPFTYDIYEFDPASYSFMTSTGGRTTSGAPRALTGLTGTSLVLTAVAGADAAGSFAFTNATTHEDYTQSGHHYAAASTPDPNDQSSVLVAATFEDHEQVMVAVGTAGAAPPPLGATTWDFRSLSALPAGWWRRGITSETFDSAGMSATYGSGQGHYYPLPVGVASGTLEAKMVSGPTNGMHGPLLAKASVQGALSGWYTSPSGDLLLGSNGSYAYDGSFANAGGSPAYPVWFRVRLASSVAYGSYSTNGTTWSSEVSIARASMGTADELNIGSILNSAAAKYEYVKWTP